MAHVLARAADVGGADGPPPVMPGCEPVELAVTFALVSTSLRAPPPFPEAPAGRVRRPVGAAGRTGVRPGVQPEHARPAEAVVDGHPGRG